MTIKRRLAALMVADVASYSALIGADEAGTRDRFNAAMSEIVCPAIDSHAGRLVSTAGDGLLAEFASVVEAVNCAIEIQTRMAGTAQEPDQAMSFRIGINLGDVLVEGDDVHGDGVNVAARLEAMAPPGGICLSRAARDQVRDRIPFEMEDLGDHALKNIARTVRVFRIRLDTEAGDPPAAKAGKRRVLSMIATAGVLLGLIGVAAFWFWPGATREIAAPAQSGRQLSVPDKPSVAVLPFKDMTGNEGALIADAITSDITGYLAQVSGLFVISGSTANTYRDSDKPIPAIASELGVRNIVQGSVSRTHPKLAVVVELVDGDSGGTVWQNRFEEDPDDIFSLKEEIALSIARELAINVTRSSAPMRTTDNETAYMFWFRASRAINEAPSAEMLDFAGAMAKSAITLDPEFGRALASLGYVISQRGYFGYVADRDAALREGQALAEQAVRIAPNDWYVHEMHGITTMNLRDYDAALKAFDRGIALAPANASMLVRSSLPLLFLGGQDNAREAERRLLTAMRINPIYNWANANFLGISLYEQGRYAEAVLRLEEAAELNPSFVGNIMWNAAAHAQLGNVPRARELAAELLRHAPNWTIESNFVRIRDDATMERLNAGLRKAGLPGG